MPAVRRNSGLCDPGAQKFLILGHHLLRKIALCIVTYNSIYTELEGKENENVATTVKVAFCGDDRPVCIRKGEICDFLFA